MSEYKVDGSAITAEWHEIVYDYFVYNEKKIVVLKNEQFDEFIKPLPKLDAGEFKKAFMLGQIFTKDDVDFIFALKPEEYEEALKYYLSLKRAFLRTAEGGENL